MKTDKHGSPTPEIGDCVVGFINSFGAKATGTIIRENCRISRVAPAWAWVDDKINTQQLRPEDFDLAEKVDEFLVVLDEDRTRWDELPVEEKTALRLDSAVSGYVYAVAANELTWNEENLWWKLKNYVPQAPKIDTSTDSDFDPLDFGFDVPANQLQTKGQ